jgi:hypothetical protein
MVYLERAIIIWIAGWMISSICFIVAKTIHVKRSGETFAAKGHLKNIAGMLIAWPVATLMYIIITYKQKRNI